MQRKAYRLRVGNSATAFFEALGLVNDITQQHTTVPAVYACVLSNVEAWCAGQYRLAMAFGGSQGNISQRVQRVLGHSNRHPLPLKAFWSSLVLSLMLAFLLALPQLQAYTSASHPLEPIFEPETEASSALPCSEERIAADARNVSAELSQRSQPLPLPELIPSPDRDTVPEPNDPNAKQLRSYTQGLERQLREEELRWREQQIKIEQEMHKQSAALQAKMRAQEQVMRQFQEEVEQAQQQLQQQEWGLQLQELELEKRALELEKMEEELEELEQQAKSAAYIKQLQQTQVAERNLAEAERALEQQEMALERQSQELELQLQLKQQPLQQKLLEKQQEMQQLSATFEAQKMELQQQMELMRAKMELKIEKARAQYEQLMQRRETMKEEGERMRERQQRSEGGQ